MFIFNSEKKWMVDAILNLQQQVKELAEKVAQPRKTHTTEEAPWGLRFDGTPRKRPGRPPKSKVQP